MNRISKLAGLTFALVIINLGFNLQVYAQNSSNDLTPKTQQYIDNLNEVQQAQNDGKPVNTSSGNTSTGIPSFWSIVFYSFLSAVGYAFWRWVKSLKNRD